MVTVDWLIERVMSPRYSASGSVEPGEDCWWLSRVRYDKPLHGYSVVSDDYSWSESYD